MAGGSDQGSSIARVYAEAILRLAESQGDVNVLLKELQELSGCVESDDGFREFLSSPTVDVAARRQAIERLFRGKYSDLMVDALQVLNRKGRLALIPAIAESYRHGRDELQGRIEIRVISAVPLPEDFREKLKTATTNYTGKEPELVESVDESLIGGLIVQIADEKFDGSVVRKVRKLTNILRDRASREIHSGRTYWTDSALAGA